MIRQRRIVPALIIAWMVSAAVRPAFAQLDPLGFIRRVPPTVIIVIDTSTRMLEDGNGYYYDPQTWTISTANDATVAAATGVNVALATTYRRKYQNLGYTNVGESEKYEAVNIIGIGNNNASFGTFYDVTRLEMAKKAIAKAVGENSASTSRWGLVKLRQDDPEWRTYGDCDKPVKVTGNGALTPLNDDCSPGNKFGIYTPKIDSSNYSVESGGNPVLVAAAANTASSIVEIVDDSVIDDIANTDDTSPDLIPAGRGSRSNGDRPLVHALDDAKTQAIAAMTADSSSLRACRNTVVILITSGQDDGDSNYTSSHNPATTATSFLTVTASGVTKRVPIYVAAIKPAAADESELQTIATNSSGRYFNVTDADGIARIINLAVQSGYARAGEFDTGAASEFLPVSPVVGTVILKGAETSTGSTLPNSETDIQTPQGVPIPLRGNVLVTAGFALNGTLTGSTSPGFDGRLRAFRVYKPEVDSSQASGYKFVKDGTPLWPNVDGRPETAGLARVHSNSNERNIFTYIPGTGMVAFTTGNAVTIGPYLGSGTDANTLIPFIRGLPLGAIIGSTPALMDPPSIDPPPDDDYGRSDTPGSYAGDHKDRRSIIWVGTNDGMIHAIDARTGFELWAFIPFNLLPKLKTLMDGQPVEQFDFFVDSSPKIADVKMNGTTWKTILIIGQAMGGVFYQAFDVTEAGMGGPAPDSDSYQSAIDTFDSGSRVQFLWSFPRYSVFDTAYYASFNVGNSVNLDDTSLVDVTPGGVVKFYGDLSSSANTAEKSVGFTWSDPAVGPLDSDRTINAVIVGSGYFPPVETQLPGRGSSAPRAGRFLYLLDVNTGLPMGGVTSCGSSGSKGCVDAGDVGNQRKNAIQADVTAAGAYAGSPIVTKAYAGDIDGRYWRFDFTTAGNITFSQMVSTGQPIYGSSALLFVGSSDQYMFFATGSDLLPPGSEAGTGTFKLYGLKDNYPGSGAAVSFTRDLSSVTSSGGLVSGERSSASPSVAGDIVFFTTTNESASAPCNDFTSNLYGLTFLGGAAYDTNASGSVTSNENPLIQTVAGRATAPFIVDQHLVFASAGAGGTNIEIFGDPEDFNNGVGQVGVRLLSWRELRD